MRPPFITLVRLEGDANGVAEVKGAKFAWRLERGGRDDVGRDDGGLFSASEDCRDADGVDSLVGGLDLGPMIAEGDFWVGRTAERASVGRAGVGDGWAGDGSFEVGFGVD